MILTPEEIDFSAYLKRYPEQANVIPAWAYADVVQDYFNGKLGHQGMKMPWSKTHGDFAFRPGEVTLWVGRNYSGKSLIVNQAVVLQAMVQHEPCVVASMEMKPHVTMARMTRQAAGARHPSDGFIQAFHDWTEGKLWLYTQQGTVDTNRILSVIRYCHEALKHNGQKVTVRHFIVDSLMKCGLAVDDYTRQKDFVDALCACARDFNQHIHLIAHKKKDGSENGIGDRYSAKGASEISDQVDNVIIVWRNERKESEANLPPGDQDTDIMAGPDAILRVDKQRHGEWSGDWKFWFHKESMQYVAAEGLRPIEFFEYHREAA